MRWRRAAPDPPPALPASCDHDCVSCNYFSSVYDLTSLTNLKKSAAECKEEHVEACQAGKPDASSCLEHAPQRGDSVQHPPHYTWLGGIEVIDITERLSFTLGNVVKYVLRADHKGKPIEDLEKAQWYLAREIKRRKGEDA